VQAGVRGLYQDPVNASELKLNRLLELMIPPHYRLGSTVVVRPSRFGVVPGSIPGLAILFSSYID
jgi:hypothetical protein